MRPHSIKLILQFLVAGPGCDCGAGAHVSALRNKNNFQSKFRLAPGRAAHSRLAARGPSGSRFASDLRRATPTGPQSPRFKFNKLARPSPACLRPSNLAHHSRGPPTLGGGGAGAGS